MIEFFCLSRRDLKWTQESYAVAIKWEKIPGPGHILGDVGLLSMLCSAVGLKAESLVVKGGFHKP